jgi:hypothetical protein
MLQRPDEFLSAVVPVDLPEQYAVGSVFLPHDESASEAVVEAFGELVSVEQIVAPVFLRVVNVCLLCQHLFPRVYRWCRGNVTEPAAVTTARSYVDYVVTEALLVELRRAENALRRIDVGT